jgi:hypothetical protein
VVNAPEKNAKTADFFLLSSAPKPG